MDILSLEPAVRALAQEVDESDSQHRNLVEKCLALVNIMERLEIRQADVPADTPIGEGICGHKRTLLHATAGLFWEMVQESRRVEDMDMSIKFGHMVLRQTPENYPDRAKWLSRLGVFYQYRFNQLGNPEDLDKAVAFQEKA
ncbi:hypothetical protein FRC10_006639, partial [Ceratobasidium sp. 414]